jgi:trimethylamine:corrinoid methyltransferase-like protein
LNPIMQPDFRVLTPDTIARIIGQAIEILQSPGIKVGTPEALELLQSSGASVIDSGGVVKNS